MERWLPFADKQDSHSPPPRLHAAIHFSLCPLGRSKAGPFFVTAS
jgi:hypothetical protein